jgi:peptide methionine sulfoxide reductase MsrB
MDSALLHGSIFHIEEKRKELENQNIVRKEVNEQFEAQYRSFSKKGAFTCVCCHKPLNMNLTKDEGRPFYFRHNDESECVYSENTKTYEKHVKIHENLSKKDLGLTVFREILEGQLKPYGAVIERGYHYKKKLSFIPD